MPQGRKLTLNATAQQIKRLEGEVLTIIDAAFTDSTQRKAVKDLVRARFADRQIHIEKLCMDGWKEGDDSVVIDAP